MQMGSIRGLVQGRKLRGLIEGCQFEELSE